MYSARVLGHVEEGETYVATVTPAVARDLLFVSTYETSDPDSNAIDQHGYQRPPTSKRFPEIGGYYADHRHLITPIIVSVRLEEPDDIARFLKLLAAGDVGAIRKAFGPQVASIVDGQHRHFGLQWAWQQDSSFLPQIPLMLYFGLSFIEEAELFNTINVTQKKLPKALIETTKGDITEAGSGDYAQRIRRLSFSLCRDDDSVWGPVNGIEQINMTGVRDPDRPVTYEGLRRSTTNMFPPELLDRLENLDSDLPLKLAKRYWRDVSEACREAWMGKPSERIEFDPVTGRTQKIPIKYRIKDLVGVASLAKLGKDVITTQIESGQQHKIEELVDKLVAVDWEKRPDNPWMRSQAGFAGQKDLYTILYKLVYSDEVPEGAEAALEVSTA